MTTHLTAVTVALPVAAILRGRERAAWIQSVYPRAAYLSTGSRLIALTAGDAARLPFGMQLPVGRSQDRPFLGLQAGSRATIGARRLRRSEERRVGKECRL